MRFPFVLALALGCHSSSSPATDAPSGGGDAAIAPLPSGAPVVMFSDLDSGPATGWQDGQAHGAAVTIWGANFGPTRGQSFVTVGGATLMQDADYAEWGLVGPARSLERITFLVPSTAAAGSGSISITVGGVTSLPIPFTVRAGHIYYVSPTGSDGAAGSYAAPWQTITHAKNAIAPGDIAYLEDGVAQTTEDNFTAYLSMDDNGASNSGTAGMPKALVAAPGATVTVGVAGGLAYGMRTPNLGVDIDDWTIAKLTLRGGTQAADLSGTGWRFVGNDLSCPNADGEVGCFEVSGTSGFAFYGNVVHDTGINPTSSKFYHATYFSTDSNHVDYGWNEVRDNFTCRALQFHSSPLCIPSCGSADTTVFNQYDLHVHDNLIHGDNCDGINFATVDPSKGPVEAYNNIVYHVGLIDPGDGGGDFSCIYVAGTTNTGSAGGGTVEIANNTLADCGANNSANAAGGRGAFTNGGGNPALVMRLRNNIAVQTAGEIYLGGTPSLAIGDHDLWFGAGDGPSQTVGNVNADPMFVNAAAFDVRLQAGSPAIDAGSASIATHDYAGVARPQGPAFDFGAYEHAP